MAKANEGIDPTIPQTTQQPQQAPVVNYMPPKEEHLQPGTFTLPSGNKITNA